MIGPRLDVAAIVATARVIDALHVEPTDPRFGGADMSMVWLAARWMHLGLPAGSSIVRFVTWPDGSLGHAFLSDDTDARERALQASYAIARTALEQHYLESAAATRADAH